MATPTMRHTVKVALLQKIHLMIFWKYPDGDVRLTTVFLCKLWVSQQTPVLSYLLVSLVENHSPEINKICPNEQAYSLRPTLSPHIISTEALSLTQILLSLMERCFSLQELTPWYLQFVTTLLLRVLAVESDRRKMELY